jgi:hypothetical protein
MTLKLIAISCLAFVSAATAGTITNLSFVSNGGGYVNDTIVGNGTSPLAFTATGSTSNAFLNNADSTVSLGYGTYYAIAFLGLGQHLGAGTVSFLLNGTTSESQSVIFPANSPGGVQFALFNLPGGDTAAFSTTGLSADRISIIADGAGLVPDGTADAFYQFSYTQASTSGVPEPGTFYLMAMCGIVVLAVRVQRRFS